MCFGKAQSPRSLWLCAQSGGRGPHHGCTHSDASTAGRRRREVPRCCRYLKPARGSLQVDFSGRTMWSLLFVSVGRRSADYGMFAPKQTRSLPQQRGNAVCRIAGGHVTQWRHRVRGRRLRAAPDAPAGDGWRAGRVAKRVSPAWHGCGARRRRCRGEAQPRAVIFGPSVEHPGADRRLVRARAHLAPHRLPAPPGGSLSGRRRALDSPPARVPDAGRPSSSAW